MRRPSLLPMNYFGGYMRWVARVTHRRFSQYASLAHTLAHTNDHLLSQYLAKCQQIEAKARFLFFSYSAKSDAELEAEMQAR